jgi:hypothetical protein
MADNGQTTSQPQDAGQPQPAPTAQGGQELSKEVRMWAMICHLAGLAGFVIPVILSGIVAPLIVWQLKKDVHPFIDQNGKEALNFQISVGIYALVAIGLCCVVVGFVVLPAVALFDLIFLLIAAVKANNGEHYHYPLTIRFVR